MDRPTTKQIEFELDFATQPVETGTQYEWHLCAHRLAREVRALRREVEWQVACCDALRAELVVEYNRGRAAGRSDVGKYANAIGSIEAKLGLVGAVPLTETVAAVAALRAELSETQAHLRSALDAGEAAERRVVALREERDAMFADNKRLREQLHHTRKFNERAMVLNERSLSVADNVEALLATHKRVEALLAKDTNLFERDELEAALKRTDPFGGME
jgi:hypothetical protein